MAPTVQALIESLQPYNRPDPPGLAALWVVHTLDIMDKHRVIPVLTTTQTEMEMTVGTTDRTPCPAGRAEMFPLVPLEHDAAIAIIRLDAPQPKVRVDARVAFTLIFADGVTEFQRTPQNVGALVRKSLRDFLGFFLHVLNQFNSLV